MGSSRSSLRRKGPSASYSIYVTNKTHNPKNLFVRLMRDKLIETDLYSQINHDTHVTAASDGNLAKEQQEKLFSTLVKAGFHVLHPEIPRAFGVGYHAVPVYASVHDGIKMLMIDIPVNPSEFGCLTITENEHGIFIQPSNPKPIWLPCKQGDPVPHHSLKAKKRDSSEEMYFGRCQGKICFVDTKDGVCDSWVSMFDAGYDKRESGELLQDTGYGTVPGKRGDFLPPNTLQVDGVYIGRIHGDYLCPIKVRDGKVRDFVSIFKMRCKRGEIVVMTDDPHWP